MLTRTETVRALRVLVVTGMVWAVYTQIVGVSSPIFAGYALSSGVSRADIGTLTSLVFLLCLFQPVGLILAGFFTNKKLFIIGIGIVEVIIVPASIFIPALFSREQAFLGFALVYFLGIACANVTVAHLSAWWADVTPADIRGRYTANRMILMSLTGMACLQLAGSFLDHFPNRAFAFRALLVLAWVTGIGGYIFLAAMPYPHTEKRDRRSVLLKLRMAARNRRLRRSVLCLAVLEGAYYVALPFFNVFMIERLELPYGTIAIVTNLALAATVVSFLVWGPIVDRFGPALVIQVLIGPLIVSTLLWTVVTKARIVLGALAMVLGSFAFSGIVVASMALFYGIVPADERRPVFMAVWMVVVNIAVAVGAFTGGRLLGLFPGTIDLGLVRLDSFQALFALSAALMPAALLLARRLPAREGVSPGTFYAYIRRGNIFSFAYYYLWYSMAREDSARARYLLRMAKSKSPAAVQPLLSAIEAGSPELRSSAALGLGEVRDERALELLIEKAKDSESDIREEAIFSLGKADHPDALATLLEALSDKDRRLRAGAMVALSGIGGPEARRALLAELHKPLDRRTFPALVEGLSRLGELSVARSALASLDAFNSPAVRLQILYAVANLLGVRNLLAQLLMTNPLNKTELEMRILDRLARRLRVARPAEGALAGVLDDALVALRDTVEHQDVAALDRGVRALAHAILSEKESLAPDAPRAVRRTAAVAQAALAYLSTRMRASFPAEEMALLETLLIAEIEHVLRRGRPGRL
ncbi:MAG: MFS transporter [Planctomycetota bacterium]